MALHKGLLQGQSTRWEVKRLLGAGKWNEAMKLYSQNPDSFTATALISHANKTMGDLGLAIRVYDTLKSSSRASKELNSFVFTALAYACQALQGGSDFIHHLWLDILRYRVSPDSRLYVSLLSTCNKMKDLSTAAAIVSHFEKSRLGPPDLFLQTVLVKTYCKLGDPVRVFNIWEKMKGTIGIDRRFYCSLLSFCAEFKALEIGESVHKAIQEQGICANSERDELMLLSSLVNMYAKCGRLGHAQDIFKSMKHRDAISWNVMIQAHNTHGHVNDALHLFKTMVASGTFPDECTYSLILSALGDVENLHEGKNIHAYLKKQYVNIHDIPLVVMTSLISMYTKCDEVDLASQLFEQYKPHLPTNDTSIWTIMIQAYSANGKFEQAMQLFKEMHAIGIIPTPHIYSTILKICAKTLDLESGKRIHEQVQEQYTSSCHFPQIVVTSLISLYIRCGELSHARQIFEEIKLQLPSSEAVITWTFMIQAYSSHNQFTEALELFREMNRAGIIPNEQTYSIIIKIFAEMTNLQEGQTMHDELLGKYGSISNFPKTILASLIFMYAKCGKLLQAKQLFEGYDIHARDVVVWTAMIQAYGMHGDAASALATFDAMKSHQVSPDAITFVCLLMACSHSGWVDQAWGIFSSMKRDFGVDPSVPHQVCMVDAWGRAGMLDQAEDFIRIGRTEGMKEGAKEGMKEGGERGDAVLWRALLGACHNWGDVDRAKRAASHVLQLEPHNSAAYILLANTYAAAGRWKEWHETLADMKSKNIKKQPGITWTTVKGQTENFNVNSDHLHKKKIIAFLTKTRKELSKRYGYVPNTSCVLHPDMTEDRKLERLWRHSEKMALAWALMNSEDNIIMHKNLRVCQDCHTSLKLISHMYAKIFVVRDANRFHHFENGTCSCNDYW